MSTQMNICGRPVEEFLLAVENFHGLKAPGVVIGGFMVDWAQEGLSPGVEADAIVETCHCLPDAVQLLTPCTFGNGWLKVLDWDKFALSLYDKKTLGGLGSGWIWPRPRPFPTFITGTCAWSPKNLCPWRSCWPASLALAGRSCPVPPCGLPACMGKKARERPPPVAVAGKPIRPARGTGAWPARGGVITRQQSALRV